MTNQLNRIYNSKNPYQGDTKKVLCVCSAGLLRSPTAAVVLSQPPYNYNTRAAGIEESYALVPVDKVLVSWADQIVCMTLQQQRILEDMHPEAAGKTIALNIEDNYAYRDPELMRKIADSYDKANGKAS